MNAAEISNIPQIGPHQRIFIYEKNENPENILVVYGKTDSQGRIQPASREGLFDFYWLMGRERYKPTHAMIKSGIRDRLQVLPSDNPTAFDILLTDLKEVRTDLPSSRLHIQTDPDSAAKDGGIKLSAYLTLGPSDHNARIRLDSIYAEASKGLNPFSRKLLAITLKGVDVKTGQKVSRRYEAS